MDFFLIKNKSTYAFIREVRVISPKEQGQNLRGAYNFTVVVGSLMKFFLEFFGVKIV